MNLVVAGAVLLRWRRAGCLDVCRESDRLGQGCSKIARLPPMSQCDQLGPQYMFTCCHSRGDGRTGLKIPNRSPVTFGGSKMSVHFT